MVGFTITTTADFDSPAVKSESSGNREIITISDVVSGAVNSPLAGEIQLENMFSDKFDIADADAVTWKWANTTVVTAVASADINTTTANKLRTSVGSAGSATGQVQVKPNTLLAGNFAYDVLVDWGGIDNNESYHYLVFFINASNYAAIVYERGLYDRIRTVSVINGTTQSLSSASTTDPSVRFQITRVGNAVAVKYSLNQSETYTTLRTFTSDFLLSDGSLYLQSYRVTTAGETHIDYGNFRITTGTPATGSSFYRTSGNWRSASQTMTAGKQLNDITITHSGLDATEYIDKIEILKASDDSVICTYLTNITSGASTNLVSSDFDGTGFAGTADLNFKVKLYLVGDGTGTPIITQIEGNYVVTPSGESGNYSKVARIDSLNLSKQAWMEVVA